MHFKLPPLLLELERTPRHVAAPLVSEHVTILHKLCCHGCLHTAEMLSWGVRPGSQAMESSPVFCQESGLQSIFALAEQGLPDDGENPATSAHWAPASGAMPPERGGRPEGGPGGHTMSTGTGPQGCEGCGRSPSYTHGHAKKHSKHGSSSSTCIH